MSGPNLANFLFLGALTQESPRDGDILFQTLLENGWDREGLADWYGFVTSSDSYTQIAILKGLFEQFAHMTACDRDTVFGLLIWSCDDGPFYTLVDTDTHVQEVLCDVFADEGKARAAMYAFGCGQKRSINRIDYCEGLVISGFPSEP